jgi:glycosyltransferase involved in cell wall biosynthesis
MYQLKDYYYGEMWQRYGVDSLHGYGDYDEGCAFALAAGMVIESICNYKRLRHKNVIAHFDEWTTGMGLLYTKWKVPYVGTIFTTHATSIGRSICGNGKALYDYLPGYNGDQMARELNMESKHSLEKAAAHAADCFTTVSDVTATECEQLLERRPDVVTPNGFPADWAPTKIKQKRARQAARQKMLTVATQLTGKKFPENTFIIATSGRCEYRNKGIDIFLDTAAALRVMNPEKDILLYVLVPAWSKAPRTDLKERLLANAAPASSLAEPAITHELNNPGEDPIINRIRQLGFAAEGQGKVSVIYVPCYLNGDDGILDMNYYDMLAGLDLTAFPSYYEPWGYTPLESVAFGVPTITTSLSGFGQWVLSLGHNGFADCGVVVVNRNDSNYQQVVGAMADEMLALSNASAATIAADSAAARETADKAEWSNFITYYVDAFSHALAAADKRRSEQPA